jgi:hypothetical protein
MHQVHPVYSITALGPTSQGCNTSTPAEREEGSSPALIRVFGLSHCLQVHHQRVIGKMNLLRHPTSTCQLRAARCPYQDAMLTSSRR